MYYNGMKKSLVSVLIPSNSEDLLSRTIDHILSSNVSEKDYEVIVCTKLPVAISHKKVKIISDPPDNVGSVRPLNECFKHSQGDYFVSIPDDLLLHPNCFNIEEFINSEIFATRKYKVCSTGYENHNECGVPRLPDPIPEGWPTSHPDWNDSGARDSSVGILCYPAGKRETVDNLLGGVIFNESFKHVAADNFLSYYLASKGESPVFMPDTLADDALDKRDEESIHLREHDSQMYFEMIYQSAKRDVKYNEIITLQE